MKRLRGISRTSLSDAGVCGWKVSRAVVRSKCSKEEWRPRRIVVGRFDSAEAAHSWWAGQGYLGLKAIRQRSTTTNMILSWGDPDAQR